MEEVTLPKESLSRENQSFLSVVTRTWQVPSVHSGGSPENYGPVNLEKYKTGSGIVSS